jgi:amino acid adenylation domain-containing protein
VREDRSRTFHSARLRHPATASGLPAALAAGPGMAQSFKFTLSVENRALIGRLAKHGELGELVLMLAALSLVLYRYDEDEDRCVYTPPFGEGHGADCVRLVFRVDEGGTIKDFILSVRRAVSLAYARPNRAVGPSRPADRSEDGLRLLVSHDGVHHPLPEEVGALFGLRFRIKAQELAVLVEDREGILPPELVQAMASHLDQVVSQFAALEFPVAELEVLSSAEKHALLVEYNDTDNVRFRELDSLPRLFEAQVRRAPDHPAVLSRDLVLTRAQLDAKANQLARLLIDRTGLKPGDSVGVLSDRSELAIIALLGALKAGCIYVPLSEKQPASRIAQVLEDASARAVLCHSSWLELVSEACELPIVAPDLQLLDTPASSTAPGIEVHPDSVAAIIFTSGSEGRPKGVPVTHRGLANVAADHVEVLGVTAQDRYLQFMALAFDGSLLDIFTGLLSDCALVMVPSEILADIDKFHYYLETHGVTMFTMTPSFLALLDPMRLQAVRAIVSAAEPARSADAELHASQRDFYNGYGPSEAAVNTTLHKAEPGRRYGAVPVGRPRANKQVYVLGRDLRPKPRGTVGQIAISGLGLTNGYLGDPELTRRKFIPHPFRKGETLYLSGDLGSWNAEGELTLIGRRDRQIKIRGFRVEPSEIEQVLLSHPDVCDATVVFDRVSSRLHAFIVGKGQCAEQGVLDHARARLPDYMAPAEIHCIERFPFTASGKVDQCALQEIAANKRKQVAARPPANVVEEILTDIWRRVLAIDEIDTEADFFRLGGDSLRMIQVVHQARKHALELDTFAMLSFRTIRDLAAYLASDIAATTSARGVDIRLAELDVAEWAELPGEDVEDAYAASRMQELMLAKYFDPAWAALATYHCVASWRFKDERFSPAALEAAVAAINRRHQALRTSFHRTDPGGRLVQVVRKCGRPPILTLDLRDAPEVAKADTLSTLMRADCAVPFELSDMAAPLVRFRLVLLTETTCQLIMSVCHAIIDGWSAVELENDLYDCYRSLKEKGDLPDDPAPAISLKEFVALEKEILANRDAASFWSGQIAGLQPLIFGARSASPGTQGFATVEHGLDQAAVRSLEASMQKSQASLKAVCLTAFLEALHALAQRDALTVGVLVNGRSERLSDPLRTVGLFWNVIPFTSHAKPSVPAVHERLTEIEVHARYPLAAIASAAGKAELFDVCFNFIRFHNARPPNADLKTIGFEAVDRLHYPLTFVLSVERDENGLKLDVRVEYNRALVSADTVDALVEQFSSSAMAVGDLR